MRVLAWTVHLRKKVGPYDLAHRLFLADITTDRGFIPLNGRRFGQSLSLAKFRNFAALTFPL